MRQYLCKYLQNVLGDSSKADVVGAVLGEEFH